MVMLFMIHRSMHHFQKKTETVQYNAALATGAITGSSREVVSTIGAWVSPIKMDEAIIFGD